MLRWLRRTYLRWWLRRHIAPMTMGSIQDIDEWIEQVVKEKIP